MIEKAVGRVARSKAGRDKGRYGLIVQIVDEEYVMVADGDLRKFNSPKKKKLKHLFLRPEKAEAIEELLKADIPAQAMDAHIRKALADLNYDKAQAVKKEG